ncbi:hypothetical protein COU91_01980 [Candidatus Saccharibacteria bacterium CG10_big_fil_rev_8_21_14_0_10_47_8]|nr:MAG: hypothetical protein COU91_01980 [Candidatus Saccharibacteria bacterium CG10_big_fil_rev_8_21_14_0_10_47_8]
MKKNQKGFSFVEVMLVLIFITLVGFVGWYVWHSNDKDKTDKTTSSASRPTTAKNDTAVDPYAGWKTYCDTETNGCFKYPADWALDSGPSINTQVLSPEKKVKVVYSTNYDCFCGPDSFYSASVDSLVTANSSLKVVGGYYTKSNGPIYYLVDSSLVKQYALAAGKTSEDVATLSVTKGSAQLSLAVYDSSVEELDSAELSAQQANNWFSSSDGTKALLIAKSFYYKQ